MKEMYWGLLLILVFNNPLISQFVYQSDNFLMTNGVVKDVKSNNGQNNFVTKYILTSQTNNQKGAIFYKLNIGNIINGFDIKFIANFGSRKVNKSTIKDYGADGIMFFLLGTKDIQYYPENYFINYSLFVRGGRLGYGSDLNDENNIFYQDKIINKLYYSYAIEFDTFWNTNMDNCGDNKEELVLNDENDNKKRFLKQSILNDYNFNPELTDHISFFSNGDMRNPLKTDDNYFMTAWIDNKTIKPVDFEDNQDHCVRIQYIHNTQSPNNSIIKIYVDDLNTPKCTNTKNLQSLLIDDTNNDIYFGLSAATGDQSNVQYVIFDDYFDIIPNKTICEGDEVTLATSTNMNNIEYTWCPSEYFDNTNINSPCPKVRVINTTIFTCNYKYYENGVPKNDTRQCTITVANKPKSEILKSFGRKKINSNNNNCIDEINGTIKTKDNCGYLLFCQTESSDYNKKSNDDLTDNDIIFDRSAMLLKTDCNGELLKKKLYINKKNNIGFHFSCIAKGLNLLEKNSSIIKNSCSQERGIIEDDIADNVGYLMVGVCTDPELSYINQPSHDKNMLIMAVNKDLDIKKYLCLDFQTEESGVDILMSNDNERTIFALGNSKETIDNQSIKNKIILTAINNEYDNDFNYYKDSKYIPFNDALIYHTQDNISIKANSFTESDCNSIPSLLILGNYGSNEILLMNIKKSNSLPINWSKKYTITNSILEGAKIIKSDYNNHTVYYFIGNYRTNEFPMRFNIILACLDENGNKLWSKCISSQNNFEKLFSYSISENYNIIDNNNYLIIPIKKQVNNSIKICYIKLSKSQFNNDYQEYGLIQTGNLTSNISNIFNVGLSSFGSTFQSTGYGDYLGDLILNTIDFNKNFECIINSNYNISSINLAESLLTNINTLAVHNNIENTEIETLIPEIVENNICTNSNNINCCLQISNCYIVQDKIDNCCYHLIFNWPANPELCMINKIKITSSNGYIILENTINGIPKDFNLSQNNDIIFCFNNSLYEENFKIEFINSENGIDEIFCTKTINVRNSCSENCCEFEVECVCPGNSYGGGSLNGYTTIQIKNCYLERICKLEVYQENPNSVLPFGTTPYVTPILNNFYTFVTDYCNENPLQEIPKIIAYDNQGRIICIKEHIKIPPCHHYSKQVNIDSDKTNEILSFVPNIEISPIPAKDIINIAFNCYEDCNVNIYLYNEEGKLIQNIFSGKCNNGKNLLNHEIKNLENGLYIVQINVNKMKIEKSILIIH